MSPTEQAQVPNKGQGVVGPSLQEVNLGQSGSDSICIVGLSENPKSANH